LDGRANRVEHAPSLRFTFHVLLLNCSVTNELTFMTRSPLLLLTVLLAINVAGDATGADGSGDRNAASDIAPLVATFSVVGFDPGTGDLGVAVQSKFFGVGSVVPWAKAGVGAIATQSRANVNYGPDGLALLQSGTNAAETLK
jgi:hypothetical protein